MSGTHRTTSLQQADTLEIRSVTFHRAAYQPGEFPRDRRPQFAMVGRSNVGKSSLINAVLNRKAMARISRTPGKTQAIQFYLINDKFYLVDLPGYGYAKVPKAVVSTWGDLIRSYLENSADLRLIFLLMDSRRVPGEHDLQMYAWARTLPATDLMVVLTKSDKLSGSQLKESRRNVARQLEIDDEDLIVASSVRKRGIEEIRRAMKARL